MIMDPNRDPNDKCTKTVCCCKCANQVQLVPCGCGKCPALIAGWVCTGESTLEDVKGRIGRYMGYQRHGECELFTKEDEG